MKPRLIALVLFMIGLQLSLSAPVFACSGMFRETTLQEHVDDASLIFVGTVMGENDANIYDKIYTVHVDSYLKGAGPSDIAITGYGTGGGDCLDRLEFAQHVIFLADGDAASDEVLHASYLQVYDSLMSVSDVNIANIATAVGHEANAPYSAPVWILIKYWTYSPVFKVAVVVGVPLIVVGGAFAVVMARRRPTKKKNDAKP